MSITLVAALPKQNTIAPADSLDADENSADLANFANLLFGQLMLAEPEIAVKKDEADIPEITLSPEDAVAAFIAPLIAARNEHLAASDTDIPTTDVAEEGDAVAALLIDADKPDTKPTEAALDPLASPAKSAKPTDSPAETALVDKPSAKIADLPSATPSQTIIQPKQAERSVLDLVDPLQEKPVTNTPVMANQATNHPPAVQEGREISFSVPTPVRDSAWASDFSNKILWMVNNGKQSAQLTLNPEHMGPVEISLSIDKGHVTANFVSTNAEVRETLETALPRLREMFANSGIELGQTNVGAESFRPPADQREAGRSASQGLDDETILATEDAEALISTVTTAQTSNNRVDLFA